MGRAQLKAPTNELCVECHGDKRALITHMPYHEEASQEYDFTCSDCHMPKMATSAVDYDIHSHTFRQPNPQGSIDHGGVEAMPNACNLCHDGHGKDPAWAVEIVNYSVAQQKAAKSFFGPGPTPTAPLPPTPSPSVGQPVDVEHAARLASGCATDSLPSWVCSVWVFLYTYWYAHRACQEKQQCLSELAGSFHPQVAPLWVRIMPYAFIVFLGMTIFLIAGAGWEYTNSNQFCGTSCHTMPAEYISFLESPHANVKCVECHIGRATIATQLTRKVQRDHPRTQIRGRRLPSAGLYQIFPTGFGSV